MASETGERRLTGEGVPVAQRTHRVGEIEVIALSDGILQAPMEDVLGVEQAEVARLGGQEPGEATDLSVNAFLVRHPGGLVLIDAGAGDSMGPGLGELVPDLAAIGVAPQEIDTVLLTHLHRDHAAGLVDAQGRAHFPAAELVVPELEVNFWLQRDEAGASERIKRHMRIAKRATAPYRERLRTAGDGERIAAFTCVLAAGHTPGHSGWMIEAGGDSLLVWGDIVHLPRVQLPRPDAALAYDVDPDAAVATRRRVLDWVAQDRQKVAGAHLDFPGYGRIVRHGTGYRGEVA